MLPRKTSNSIQIPRSVLNELTEAPLLIYKKNFLLFKYLVYELISRDESEIIQRISHDLKNQVLMIKLLTDQNSSELKKINHSYVDQMSSTLKYISSVTQTLSNFSHIDKLFLEEIELCSFLEQLIMNHMNHDLFENINYSPCKDRIIINLDKNLFRIAFDNILNNALEEIKSDQQIDVYTEAYKNEIKLMISNHFDDGERNIEDFINIGYSSKAEGSGIGLPIAKIIIERHNGSFDYFVKDGFFYIQILMNILSKKSEKSSHKQFKSTK
jgi:two-component system sensor histidine kinase VanS